MLHLYNRNTGRAHAVIGIKAHDHILIEQQYGPPIELLFSEYRTNQSWYSNLVSPVATVEDLMFQMIESNDKDIWIRCVNNSLYYIISVNSTGIATTNDGISIPVNTWFVGDYAIKSYERSIPLQISHLRSNTCDCGGIKLRLPHSSWCSTNI